MRRSGRRKATRTMITGVVVMMGLGLVLALTGCEDDNDPTAPEGSTITVSANPQTVVIPTGGGSGASLITATLRSSNGTRLPDQEITFRTTAGMLTPPDSTPQTTDDQGQAQAILTTSTSATVTATSGSISGETQVQTASGEISVIILNVTPQELTSCNDVLTLTARVLASDGSPVSGIVLTFDEIDATVTGSFSPAATDVTDVAGEITVTWEASPVQCRDVCSTDTGGTGICDLSFFVEDISQSFTSNTVTINDNIP